MEFETEILKRDGDDKPVLIAMIAVDREGEVLLYDTFRRGLNIEQDRVEYRGRFRQFKLEAGFLVQ